MPIDILGLDHVYEATVPCMVQGTTDTGPTLCYLFFHPVTPCRAYSSTMQTLCGEKRGICPKPFQRLSLLLTEW
jgi:hypothetical protein